MKKIKILTIGMSSNLGGIETYLYNLYKNADKNKFEFSFLTFEYGEKICFEDELIKDGVKFYKITPRTTNYFRFLKELKEIYQKNHFDYIHFNLMDFSCFERITYAKKYSQAKIIIHSHNGGFGKNVSLKTRLLHKLGKIKIRNIPYMKVACGQAAGTFMFGEELFTIFNNGIDIDKFKYNQKNRQEIRKELNIKEDTTVIGLVAKLEHQKNIPYLIDIFYKYQLDNPNSKLVLVGEGSLKNIIEEQINNYQLNDKVLLLGKRLDTNKIYSAFDLFIMPSLYEGLSISLIEAQVNGLKCYTSNNVDKNSNITGNVEFLSLEQPPEDWAKYILNKDNSRDDKVLDKIPDEFNAKKSYEKVYKFYQNNLK